MGLKTNEMQIVEALSKNSYFLMDSDEGTCRVPKSTVEQIARDAAAEAGGGVSTEEMNSAIEDAVSDKVSTTQMNTAIQQATSGKVTETEMNTAIETATKDKVTTTEMNTAIQEATEDLPTADEIADQAHGAFIKNGGVPYGSEITESWASLQARIKNGDFSGIKIGDYKTITLTGGETVIMEVAGIDQYYQCGDTAIGHHIDFISRDCLSGYKQFNTTNNNNGTEAEPNPWRASALFQTMNTTVWATLPEDLKNCIIQKRALLESRYAASGAITEDNSWAWNDMGNLWLPTEVEVFGCTHWSQPGFGSGGGGCNKQYPIFMGNSRHLIKGNGNGGGRCLWWEASALHGNSTYVCSVSSDGDASGNNASSESNCAPLCFRIG